jgi:hydrogenase nickel incorporation protein HypA/HybF
MHELGLMQTAVDAAVQAAVANHAARITKLTLWVGDAAGADPDVLRMGFDAITRNTIANGATLVIEAVPVMCHCSACRAEFTPARADELYFACPLCGSFEVQVRAGRDISVGAVEVT